MRRYIRAAGVACVLLAGALVIVPRTVQAAPVHARTASIRLAVVIRANVAIHPAAHLTHGSGAHASRAAAVPRGATHSRVAATRYAGAAAMRFGTTIYARMGHTAYGRFSAAKPRGYAARARHAATGTIHNCPHMTSRSTSGK